MLAKIASDWRKPNGQFAITPEQVVDFVRDLPVRKIWGVGPKSAEKFAREGVKTCGDLQRFSLPELLRAHGKWGGELYRLCRGDDQREVEPNQVRKSLSNESTFPENLTTLEDCQREMEKLVAELVEELRMKALDRAIRKAFVKVKFADFTRTTRECVCLQPTRETYHELLAEAWKRSPLPVRLLGSGVRFAEESESTENAQAWLDLEAAL
jgi:DNA polymerase-4